MRGDLDWIVMKALDKDRNRRYETASEFAEDIGRYLKDEPVEACPPSVYYFAGKFMHRHKAALATATVVLTLVVGGLAVGMRQIAQQRDAAVVARADEMRQRQAAEASLQKARQIVDRLFLRAADELEGVPGMTKFQGELLEDALEFYQGFLQEKSTDPEIRRGTASAYYRVGTIQQQLGKGGEAEESYRAALALQEKLADEFPLEHKYWEDLASSCEALGGILTYSDRREEGHEFGMRAHVISERLAADFPDNYRYRTYFAWSHLNFAHRRKNRDELDEQSEGHFRQSLALFEKVSDDFGLQRSESAATNQVRYWFGKALLANDRLVEAEEYLGPALAFYERHYASRQTNLSVRERSALSVIKEQVGMLLLRRGKREEAEELFRDAIALNEQLAADFPHVVDRQRGLAHLRAKVERLLGDNDSPKEEEGSID